MIEYRFTFIVEICDAWMLEVANVDTPTGFPLIEETKSWGVETRALAIANPQERPFVEVILLTFRLVVETWFCTNTESPT